MGRTWICSFTQNQCLGQKKCCNTSSTSYPSVKISSKQHVKYGEYSSTCSMTNKPVGDEAITSAIIGEKTLWCYKNIRPFSHDSEWAFIADLLSNVKSTAQGTLSYSALLSWFCKQCIKDQILLKILHNLCVYYSKFDTFL